MPDQPFECISADNGKVLANPAYLPLLEANSLATFDQVMRLEATSHDQIPISPVSSAIGNSSGWEKNGCCGRTCGGTTCGATMVGRPGVFADSSAPGSIAAIG